MAAAKVAPHPPAPIQLAVTVQNGHLRELFGDRVAGAVVARVVEYECVQRYAGNLLSAQRAQTGEGEVSTVVCRRLGPLALARSRANTDKFRGDNTCDTSRYR
jgi:hypothetical protein